MKIRRVTLLVGSSIALAVAFGIFAGAPSGGQIAGVSDRQFLGAGEVDRFLAGVGGELGSGCALLLARQGKVFYEKSSGGFDARKPVRIASATKWLSGAVIISLVDEGKIKLDDLASRYLSGLTGEASRITVRQLLSHTSGLPMAHPALGERDITLKQAVDAIVTTPLVFPPGRACAYGDVSIQVAGRIAEIASGIDKPSGQLWKSLFTSRLSIPLEMTGTSCEGLRPTDNPHLAGGATSTARDYARFLSMLVNKGTLDGRRVLSEAAVAEMLRDQTGGSPLRFNPFQDQAGDILRIGLREHLHVQSPERMPDEDAGAVDARMPDQRLEVGRLVLGVAGQGTLFAAPVSRPVVYEDGRQCGDLLHEGRPRLERVSDSDVDDDRRRSVTAELIVESVGADQHGVLALEARRSL